MKNLQLLLVAFLLMVIINSCDENKKWQPLFNGQNLENWDKYLGTPLSGFEDLAEKAIPEDVFSVVEKDGVRMIRISGEVNGSLATRDSFSDFHLKLVFKWGNDVYTQRNSGLLYHSFGNFGEALGTWMVCIECQLMHGRMGDTYLMNNTCCETKVEPQEDGSFVYSKDGTFMQFGIDDHGQGIKKAVDAENPVGEWNTVELYSVGRTTVYVVNGTVTMVDANTGKKVDGEIIPLTSGKIQLQSEGAELFVKSIQIQPIKKIPNDLLN